MENDEFINLSFIRQAIVVEPNDDEDLPNSGILYLDQNSTEGVAKVDLIDGGTITIQLTKENSGPFYVVKKVYYTDTTAIGIYLNPNVIVR